jgi:hypothetical protein
MKEKPILFSSEMVRAILDGRKTQTRRVIKPQPTNNCKVSEYFPQYGKPWWIGSDLSWSSCYEYKCPYGNDLLWVRETWRIVGWHEGEPYLLEYRADGAQLEEPGDSSNYDEDKYSQYAFDSSEDCDKAKTPMDEDGIYHIPDGKTPTRWRPSIFMPHWASRITLKITNVRVERLQHISIDNIGKEGIYKFSGNTNDEGSYVHQFVNLWNSINAKYPWESNPWVWVI